MRDQGLSLGRIWGIPIRLDYSWFLIFVLITWSLAAGYYPDKSGGLSKYQYWILGEATAILLFGSVLLHELGHSLIARRYNIQVHSITLFVFGGMAQISTEPPNPWAEFWISLAGPVISFSLALLFRVTQPIFHPGTPWLALLQYLARVNGAIALFNLIPGFPLDGGRIFRAFVWACTHNYPRASMIAAHLGQAVALLFIAYGILLIGIQNALNGMLMIFVGWFLDRAASMEMYRQLILSRLMGRKVSQAMSQNYKTVPAETTLQDLVLSDLTNERGSCLLIEKEEKIVGLVTLKQVKETPQNQLSSIFVSQVMRPVDQLPTVGPESELGRAWCELIESDATQLPVMENGKLVGVLSREGIINFLQASRKSSVSGL